MTSPAIPAPIPPAKARDSFGQMVGRFIFTALIGPLVGSIGVVIVILLPAVPRDRPSISEFFDTVGLVLQAGWLFGVIPAILAALAMIAIGRRPLLPTLLITAVVGAVSGVVGLTLYSAIQQLFPPVLGLLLIAAPAGAVSLPICTLFFDRVLRPLFPTPAP